ASTKAASAASVWVVKAGTAASRAARNAGILIGQSSRQPVALSLGQALTECQHAPRPAPVELFHEYGKFAHIYEPLTVRPPRLFSRDERLRHQDRRQRGG